MSPTEKRIARRQPSLLRRLEICEAMAVAAVAKLEAEAAKETETNGFPSDITWEILQIRTEQLRNIRLEIAKKKKKA